MVEKKKPTEWWETREGRRKRFRELLERRVELDRKLARAQRPGESPS